MHLLRHLLFENLQILSNCDARGKQDNEHNVHNGAAAENRSTQLTTVNRRGLSLLIYVRVHQRNHATF